VPGASRPGADWSYCDPSKSCSAVRRSAPAAHFKRRDDFFVVVEAGGVFHGDEGFGAEGEREGAPESLAAWFAQSFAKWPERFVDIAHPAASAHRCVVAVTLVGEPGVQVDALAGADQGLVGQQGRHHGADEVC